MAYGEVLAARAVAQEAFEASEARKRSTMEIRRSSTMRFSLLFLQQEVLQRYLRTDSKVCPNRYPLSTARATNAPLCTAWRKVLKDLITYFRDVQKSYEARSKSLHTLSNVVNNIDAPNAFLRDGGIGDATSILREYHKKSIQEGNKAKTLEEDVIVQLTGLRSDLAQKIKEIKSLSGDFKNSVDKETEGTRKAVHDLQEALGVAESDRHASSGKGDPFIVKLGVDRQVARQIEEENYLHRVRPLSDKLSLQD